MFKNKYFKIITIVLAIMLFVVGCQTQNKDVTNQESEENIKDDKKILNIGIASETDFMSQQMTMDTKVFPVGKLVYETLITFEEGEFIPVLAESWEFSNDGKDLTFKIRPDVKLHDSTELNAELVKANLENKSLFEASHILAAIANIESMEVIDNLTLTIHYKSPNYSYLGDFCWPDVMTIVSQKQLIDKDAPISSDVIGTGPYKYGEIVHGSYTRFVRNEDYWGEKPYYDEIIAKYIPDSQSRLKALKNGEIDLIYGSGLMDYDDYNSAIAIPGIEGKIADADTRARDITLNAGSEILSDINVRKAIAHAINKKEISEGITGGIEGVADLPFTKDSLFVEELKLESNYSYDLDEANKLLDEAGWKLNANSNIREKDGKQLTLKYTTYPMDATNASITKLIKSQLDKVGIDVKIVELEKMDWFNGYMMGDFDITTWLGQYAYANPNCWYNAMPMMTPQTYPLNIMDGGQDFLSKIAMTQSMDKDDELYPIFNELINYNLGEVLDIPLTYQKEIIVYRTDKIKDYKFFGITSFFDSFGVSPEE